MIKESNFLLILSIGIAVLFFIKTLNFFSEKFPPSLKRIVSWIHALTFELLAICVTFCLRPSGFFSRKGKLEGKGRPILLIHGYLQNGSNWVFLKNELRRKGFGPLYTLNLSHPFHSIQYHATTVAKKVAQIQKETGSKELCLIGHSMGGLVSSWYALTMASPGIVTDVVTIGSPLQGTHIALIALGENGRAMRRGSEFVMQLQGAMQKNEKIRFYHIASKTDQLIMPWHSAVTKHDLAKQYVMEGIGHMSLLFSPRVARQIQTWLKPVYTNHKK